jgi:hypothetical protein
MVVTAAVRGLLHEGAGRLPGELQAFLGQMRLIGVPGQRRQVGQPGAQRIASGCEIPLHEREEHLEPQDAGQRLRRQPASCQTAPPELPVGNVQARRRVSDPPGPLRTQSRRHHGLRLGFPEGNQPSQQFQRLGSGLRRHRRATRCDARDPPHRPPGFAATSS